MIPFYFLPHHIQMEIIQKMECVVFSKFQQSSVEAMEKSSKVKSRFSIPTEFSANIRFILSYEDLRICVDNGRLLKEEDNEKYRFNANEATVQDDLSEGFCKLLINYFQNTGSTVSRLTFDENRINEITCSTSSFHELLKIADIKYLNIPTPIDPEYFRKVPENVKIVRGDSSLENEDFISAKVTDFIMRNTKIGSFGLNMALKEWFEQKRALEYIFLTTESSLTKKEVLHGIQYLKTEDPETVFVENGSKRLRIVVGAGFFEASIEDPCL